MSERDEMYVRAQNLHAKLGSAEMADLSDPGLLLRAELELEHLRLMEPAIGDAADEYVSERRMALLLVCETLQDLRMLGKEEQETSNE